MASDQVISTVTHVFRDMAEEDAGGLAGLLRQMANEAHTIIRLAALSTEKEPHSTMVVLVVRKNYAIWAHAGDSRLYHFRDGVLKHRTEDQTYAAFLRSEGRHEDALIYETKFRNVLASGLGLKRPPKLVINEATRLQVGDAFLLCSDGLWNYFEDAEIGRVVAQLPPREAGDALIRAARERARGRGDNISIAIVKLDAPEAKPQ